MPSTPKFGCFAPKILPLNPQFYAGTDLAVSGHWWGLPQSPPPPASLVSSHGIKSTRYDIKEEHFEEHLYQFNSDKNLTPEADNIPSNEIISNGYDTNDNFENFHGLLRNSTAENMCVKTLWKVCLGV